MTDSLRGPRVLVVAALAAVLAGGCGAADTGAGAPSGSPLASALPSAPALPSVIPDPAGPSLLPTPGGPVLNADDRALLAQARRSGQPTVVLIVATAPGGYQSAVDGLTALGGVLDSSDDAVGYLRLTVPTAAVEQALTVPGITSVDIDRLIPLDDPRPDTN